MSVVVARRLYEAFQRAKENPAASAQGAQQGGVMRGTVESVSETGMLTVSYSGGSGVASPVSDEFCPVGSQVYLIAEPGGKLACLGYVR